MSKVPDLSTHAPENAVMDAGADDASSLDEALAREAERYRSLVEALGPDDDLATIQEESRQRIAQLMRRANFFKQTPPVSAQTSAPSGEAAVEGAPPQPAELSKESSADAPRAQSDEEERLRGDVAQWCARAEKAEERAADLGARASAAYAELESVRRAVEAHRNEAASLLARTAAADARCAALEAELVEMAARRNEAEGRAADLDARLNALAAKLDLASQREEARARESAALLARAAAAEARSATLADELTTVTARCDEAERRAAALDVRASSLASVAETFRDREEAHSSESAALLARASAAESRCAALEGEQASAASREAALRRELAEVGAVREKVRARIAEVTASLAAQRDQARDAEQLVVEARARAEAAEVELRRERDQRTQLEAELAEAKNCLQRATELLLHSPDAEPDVLSRPNVSVVGSQRGGTIAPAAPEPTSTTPLPMRALRLRRDRRR